MACSGANGSRAKLAGHLQMEDNSSEQTAARQRIDDAYSRGNKSILVMALTLTQQQQFCRAVIALAHAECARVLPAALVRTDAQVVTAMTSQQNPP
jgi:hypothetical protein